MSADLYSEVVCQRCCLLYKVIFLACVLIFAIFTLLTTPTSKSNPINTRYEYGFVVRNFPEKRRISWCVPLHYKKNIKASSLPVALASFPGSGNTWLRYLLQQVTGILTGSVYKDYYLKENGFPAEFVSNNSVLLVKTHEFGEKQRRDFSKAILLIRNPKGAIQADFQRTVGGHTGFIFTKETRSLTIWYKFVFTQIKYWEAFYLDWGNNFKGPLHIVYYKDLIEDLESTLRGILHFLEVNYSEKSLACCIKQREGIYKRRKLDFNPYSEKMETTIKISEDIVNKALNVTET